MPVTPRWSDDRLDDLQYRVSRVEPVVGEVGVLKERLEGLTRELKANTNATREVAQQMEKAQLEPMTRVRNFRSQMLIAVVAALAGGGIAVLGAVIASHP